MPDFSIQNIVAHISGDDGLLTPNRYEVFVNGPVAISEKILFNCHRASIPAQSIGTFDHSVIGPMRKIPNLQIFDDLSTSFYVNNFLNEVNVMHQWMKLISGKNNFRIGYYNDLVSDMRINIYNLAGTKTAVVNIYEAYPIGISDVELSYAGQVPAEVTINWAYHSFELESNQFVF